MKLSDQEQVILRAIERVGRNGLASISEVVKAVGYPKATTKKVLVRLSEKGAVSLHRHDWPASLKPEQRKLMVRIGSNYYNAVSMRKRNPEKKSKGKTALKKTGRALKGFAKGALSAGAQILGAGAEALNPVRRKVRNKYIDLVIKGQAKKTPEGWRVGKKTFAQGRGTVSVSSGYYLDRSTGLVYAKRERNTAKKASKKKASKKRTTKKRAAKRRNVAEGFYDASGVFHPIRSSSDYSPSAAGETGGRSHKTRSKKKARAKRKASATARHRSVVKTRKASTRRLAGRALKKSSGLLKKKRRNPTPQVLALVNGSRSKAARNRKEFAGEYRKDLPLRYPEGTPQGLSKLGKLLKIKTDRAVITPINNQTWLVRDLKGKLHIGTTSKDGLIWSGPAEDFGHVKRIEYEDVKKHLGYDKPQGFYHFMGEEDGIRPRLYADGRGGLKFKGGNYRITPEGIVN